MTNSPSQSERPHARMSAMPIAACIRASAAIAPMSADARRRYVHASSVVAPSPTIMNSRSRRISRSIVAIAGMLFVGPVHFGSGRILAGPIEAEIPMLRAHGLRGRHLGCVPEEAALGIDDVHF